jgi:hypothetical protein
MNVIQIISENQEHYINCCVKSLTKKVDFISIDCSRGEADFTTIAYLKKEKYNFIDAISILTMRLKMYKEEWKDYENYSKLDTIRWSGMLEKEYGNSEFITNVNEEKINANYLINRLFDEKEIKQLKLNDDLINFEMFDKINPIKEKKAAISESIFERLEMEYYLETENHFVLLNWFTTA